MTVHHLNCGTMRPAVAPAVVAHVLLVERPDGLLLVDTGFGTGDLTKPSRLGRPFVTMMRPALDSAETALAQVQALGFSADDVTAIIPTHMDLDHIGGLGDFPNATVHVFGRELDAATKPLLRERQRYISQQWAHDPNWKRYDEPGDSWLGFDAVGVLDDDVLLIPLPGHTRGHCGVAVRRPDGHWLLHAGDAFFDSHQMDVSPSCNRSLAMFQVAMAMSNKQRKANLERLHELATTRSDEVTVFCAHDRRSFEQLAGA